MITLNRYRQMATVPLRSRPKEMAPLSEQIFRVAKWSVCRGLGCIGCRAVRARMGMSAIVKIEVPADRCASVANAVVGPQIHLLVFDAAP
jgi:hypothetical protein